MAMAVAGCIVVSFVMLALGSRRGSDLDIDPDADPNIDPNIPPPDMHKEQAAKMQGGTCRRGTFHAGQAAAGQAAASFTRRPRTRPWLSQWKP